MEYEICGKALTGRQRSYCSSECRRQAIKKQKAEYRKAYDVQFKKPKAEATTPKKRGRQKKTDPIAEINAKARAEGLTYGQYVGKYGL